MTTTGTTIHVDRELTQGLMRSFAPPVALPEQLRNELVSTYSARLYGAPGRVSLDTLRIIWPALLDSAARAALRGNVLGRDRRGSGGARGSGELPLAPPSGTRPGRLAAPSRRPPPRESPPRGPTRPGELPPLAPSRFRESPPVVRVARV